jgi:hypothetical protein
MTTLSKALSKDLKAAAAAKKAEAEAKAAEAKAIKAEAGEKKAEAADALAARKANEAAGALATRRKANAAVAHHPLPSKATNAAAEPAPATTKPAPATAKPAPSGRPEWLSYCPYGSFGVDKKHSDGGLFTHTAGHQHADGDCITCPHGKYSMGAPTLFCKPCSPQDKFTSADGTMCLTVPPPKVQERRPTQSSALNRNPLEARYPWLAFCPSGSYGRPLATTTDHRPQDRGDTDENGDCVTCPSGKFSGGTPGLECAPCNAGFHFTSTDGTTCTRSPEAAQRVKTGGKRRAAVVSDRKMQRYRAAHMAHRARAHGSAQTAAAFSAARHLDSVHRQREEAAAEQRRSGPSLPKRAEMEQLAAALKAAEIAEAHAAKLAKSAARAQVRRRTTHHSRHLLRPPLTPPVHWCTRTFTAHHTDNC